MSSIDRSKHQPGGPAIPRSQAQPGNEAQLAHEAEPGSEAQPGNEPELLEEHDEQDDAVIGRAFLWSLAVILLAGAVTGGIVWWSSRQQPDEPAALADDESEAQRRVVPAIVPEIPFTDVTRAAGIDFVHENGARGEKLLPETMAGGCAFFDFDGDGDADILFVNARQWPWDVPERGPLDVSPGEPPGSTPRLATLALYRNDGRGNYVNVTTDAGLNVSLYGMGVACGDYDNDGFVDVYVSAVGPNKLFRNTGEGFFVETTAAAGVAGAKTDPHDWSTSCGFFDCEGDGDLDLFVCSYLKWSRQYDLDQNFRLTTLERAYGRPQAFEGTFSYLYRNDGDGSFTDVSAEAGVQVVEEDTGVPLGKSLGVTFADLNGDDLPEIVVANDTVRNFLFLNRGGGRFEEVGRLSGLAFDTDGNARGAMGIDAGSFRNGREVGIAIGNFSNEMSALYVSYDGRTFTDEAVSNGIGPVTRQQLTFGLFFFDADLDGRLDLFSANGHLEVDIEKGQARQRYEQPIQLLWNAGKEQASEFVELGPRPEFDEQPPSDDDASRLAAYRQRKSDYQRRLREFKKRYGDLGLRTVGRGASCADIDADGDVDLLIVATGKRPTLLRNDQQLGRHWLRVRLVGTTDNRDAVGAWAEVHAGGEIYRQQVMPTRSYISQVEPTLTFGLGDSETVQKLVIHWPGGETAELPEVAADQSILVRQSAAAFLVQ